MIQTQLDEFTATQIKAHWMCVALERMAKELRKIGLRLKQERDYARRVAVNDVAVAVALVKSRCTAQGVDFGPILEITQWVKDGTRPSLAAACLNAAEELELAKMRIAKKGREEPIQKRPVAPAGELPDLGLSTVNNAMEREEAAVVHDTLECTGGAIRRRPDYFKCHWVTSYGRR